MLNCSLTKDLYSSIIIIIIMFQKDKKEDTYSYKGWLNSDSFMKRAFAIYGYGLVAGLIIVGIFWGALLILGLLFGAFL
jgi:hypothetical protein